MDGFESTEAVVVLAATNRPDMLDAALLRPGRFDRRVAVQAPDREGRREILEVHTRSIPLADSVDLDALAASMPGMVGADLANLANEAALLGARRDHDKVWMSDFTDALEKIMLGAPRGIVLLPADRERTAYHEAGHALVGMLTPGADPVRKISIIPRGMALGVTIATPDTDRVSSRATSSMRRSSVALGGRAAEEIVYAQISTGAESDIQLLTEIARQMVGRWGMSAAIGPMAVLPPRRLRPAAAGRQRDLVRRPSSSSTRRSAGSSRPPTKRSRACSANTASNSTPRARAARRRDPRCPRRIQGRRRRHHRQSRDGPRCGLSCDRADWGAPTDRGRAMTADEQSEQFEIDQAAAEAAGIGGVAGDEDLPPARRAVIEAGGGQAEGFEESEKLLIEHASHADQQAAHAILHDAGRREQDNGRREDGEADCEQSSELR